MSEFYYYGTTLHDNVEIIEHILNNTDLYLIPHINYKNKNDLIFARKVDDNIKYLISKIGQFHLWNVVFYPIFPLNFYTYKSGKYKGMISINASPSLTLSLSRFVVVNGDDCLRIAAGCLYHTRLLYDKKNNTVIPIPQTVKEEHKKVVKLMKEKMEKVKKKNIWMGKEAFGLFEKNELEIYDGMGWIKKENL